MTKKEFYIFFSVFNIVLVALTLLCTFGGFLMLFNELPEKYTQQVSFCGLVLYLTIIIVKILLPQILVNIGQKYNGSTIDKFLRYIKENSKEKKQILLSAFIFDLFFMTILIWIFGLIFLIHGYIMIYLCGLFFFYIAMFFELETYE